MGKITISIDDELERKLRIKIVKGGGKKGSISHVFEEMIKKWLQE